MSDEQQQHGRGSSSSTVVIVILLVILLIVAVGIWAIVTATRSDADRLVYAEKSDGTLEVTEIKSTYKDGWFCRTSLTVPEEVNGKKVTSIAHIDSAKLQKIVLPDSVTNIGTEAFSGNSSLSEIHLGNSVRTIGDGAWKQCSSLRTVSFPNTVETVGVRVFEGAPIEYNQNGGLNYIGNAQNPYLVLMGVGDTFVPEASVHENTKLAAKCCFEFTDDEKNQQLGNKIGKINTGNIDILPERMFMGCDRLEEVITAASELGANCFDKCTGLRQIEVSAALTTLRERCLAETGLTELYLPASVVSFAEDAVQGSASLAILQLNNDKYRSAHNILYDKDLTKIIAVAEGMPETTVLSGLKPALRDIDCLGKLSACGKLTSVEVENGGSVEFSATVSGVEHDYTYFAEGGILYKGDSYTKSGADIREVTLHTVPRAIGNVVLSDDLTALSADAFSACTKLKTISIGGEGTITFTQGASPKEHTYTYFAESGLLYRTDNYTEEGEQIKETAIFAVPRAIGNVVLSDKITSLSANTFSACAELKTISIEGERTITITQGTSSNQHTYTYFAESGLLYKTDKYTEEGKQVEETAIFAVPRAIGNVVLSDKITSISADAFSACEKLKTISIEGEGTITVTEGTSSNQHTYTYFAEGGLLYRTDNYTEEGEQIAETAIFAVPRAIGNVVLSDKITSISANTFSACKELTSVDIPSAVKKIEAGAFSGCEKLAQAIFRETEGWKVAKDDKGTEEQALSDLGDPAKAAKYLIKDYVEYIWNRK